MREKDTNPFYGSMAWKRCRQRALDRDMGLCVWCRERGRFARDGRGRKVPVLATTVHHIQHLDEHPELALVLSNLVSLCDRCHDEAHPEKHEKTASAGGFELPEECAGIKVERL